MFPVVLGILVCMTAAVWYLRIWNTIEEVVLGRKRSSGYFSLERAAFSYSAYHSMALGELQDMRRSYAKLSRAHKHIGYELGYTKKLNKLEEAMSRNALVTQAIADLAQREFPSLQPDENNGDLGRVRETLKHFVRDWSFEGQEEREAIFSPILDALALTPADRRADMRVLVPGAGLGRLAWEISQLGAHVLVFLRSLQLTRCQATTRRPSSCPRS